MASNRFLLALIGRRFPAVFDVIPPHGPLSRLRRSRLEEVALNPQPLPPLELGAAIAAEFVQTAWFATRFGLDQGIAFEELDDWCPTVPKWPKLPPWWPPIPDPDPEPHPEWLVDYHLGFAAQLAVAAAQYEGTPLSEALDRAIERSVGALESLAVHG